MFANVAGKRIALGVCGGIAAYKVVEVARELTQAGADVRVVMSPSATNFVGAITFSTLTANPVRTDLFPDDAPSQIPHTDLGRTSDLVVIAPATAKTMAKFAQGISDDLMSALLLSATCPVLMAPAMHTEMWENEATQSNINTLSARGVTFVGPESGALAGPDIGVGRLAEPATILQAIDDQLRKREELSGVSVIVTAGGTQEPIDAVRFIGNRSSGLMGYEIARSAIRRGAKVTLITGPSHLISPAAAEVIAISTAAEMRDAVVGVVDRAEVLIMAAAVADWAPVAAAGHKFKKAEGPPPVALQATIDILAEVGQMRAEGRLPGLRALVGFCAETSDLSAHSKAKLASKQADLMIANQVGVADSGFDAPTNKAVLADTEGIEELPLMPKRLLADLILDRVARLARRS